MPLPSRSIILREELDLWLESLQINPMIVGEFDDAVLLKAFGQKGDGIFIAPTVIENEIHRQYEVSIVGRTKKGINEPKDNTTKKLLLFA